MAHPARKQTDARFTWNDYRAWPDSERWELINGVVYAMSPAPSTQHQSVTLNLVTLLKARLAGKPCKPFIAPTDVKLSDLDVVQPDILIVCNPARITPSHIEGAPDVVVEVLSPGTSSKDLREKKALYERFGVAEYLVVDPLEQYAIRFLHGADGFDKGIVFAADETLTLATLEGVAIPLWEVFERPPPAQE